MILDGTQPESMARAADALAAGALVGLPTETVYGLAADAENDDAVRAVFAAKGRPTDHPLIVHVGGDDWLGQVRHFASAVPPFAQALMQALWPGPLTLILPRQPSVAEVAAGGNPTVGLRAPAHPVAQALLAACAARGVRGLAAPSANRFGRVSPTTAHHVAAEFGDALLVLDGGACQVGIESTIVDCTRGVPVLLRPGQLSVATIERVAGVALRQPHELTSANPKASGTLSAHYAPAAKVRLMSAPELQTALELLGDDAAHIGVWARTAFKRVSPKCRIQLMPVQAADAARELFAVLRAFDDGGVRLIWVETPPLESDWDGVRDRLQRAAASA